MNKVITDEHAQCIVLMYNSGMSITQISERLGYKRSTVGAFLGRIKKKSIINTNASERLGVTRKPRRKQQHRPKPPKPPKPLTEDEIRLSSEITKKYLDSQITLEDLAKEYKMSVKRIHQIVEFSTGKYKPPRTRSEHTIEILEDIKKGDLSLTDIGKKYGITRQCVSRLKRVHLDGQAWGHQRRREKKKDKPIHFVIDDIPL